MVGQVKTLDEFDDLAFIHGPDVSIWPSDARTACEAFLKTSAEAQSRLVQMAEVEQSILAARPADPEPSLALMNKILADAATVGEVSGPASVVVPEARGESPFNALIDWFLAIGAPATACAASAAFGLWLGYSGPVDLASAANTFLEAEDTIEVAFLSDMGASQFEDALGVLELGE